MAAMPVTSRTRTATSGRWRGIRAGPRPTERALFGFLGLLLPRAARLGAHPDLVPVRPVADRGLGFLRRVLVGFLRRLLLGLFLRRGVLRLVGLLRRMSSRRRRRCRRRRRAK